MLKTWFRHIAAFLVLFYRVEDDDGMDFEAELAIMDEIEMEGGESAGTVNLLSMLVLHGKKISGQFLNSKFLDCA